MATPRKHWFRVADSIGREAWSNDILATAIRLMGALNNQWARDGLTAEQACRIELRKGDLLALAGTEDARTALRRCHQLAIAVHGDFQEAANPLDSRRKVYTFLWPKWSEFQGLHSREQDNSGEAFSRELPPPQDAPARRKTQDAKREGVVPSAPPAAPKKSKRRTPQVEFPGAMTDQAWRELAEQYGVSPPRLFEAARDWAGETDRRYTANGWRLAIGRALRDRWSWTSSLFAESGTSRRRTYADDVSEQNAEAFRQVVEDFNAEADDPVELFAIRGGER